MTNNRSARKKRRAAPTVRAILPAQLAHDEKGQLIYPPEEMPKAKELLFAALEAFANLGNTIEDLRSFRQQYSWFQPIPVRLDEPDLPHGGLSDALHPLILDVRKVLQLVWRQGGDSGQLCADTLLGLNQSLFDEGLRAYEADPNYPGLFSEAALRSIQPYRHLINYSEIHARWDTGDFDFVTVELFHKAVYYLFRESWRARICPQCARHFIAEKPPQLYCSTACYGTAKRKRDLRWWRKEGAVKRIQKRFKAHAKLRKKR
jgi:hypothetical protein